jgi:hypothetical protein
MSIHDLRCSQGKTLGLLRREDVVPIQISTSPDDRNYEKGDEARPIVDYPSKWKHDRYPPDYIVGNIYEANNRALFNRSLLS